MSLSTRIAIAPSRCLAFAEAAMIAGAITATAATVAAHPLAESASGALGLVASAAALIGLASGAWRYIDRMRSCGHEVFIGERAGVSARRLGDDVAPQPFMLTDAAMAWPRFAMLSLSSAQELALRTARRDRVLHIPIVRREMNEGDARRLHRFLLWAGRAGSHAIDPAKEGSLG